MGSWGNNRVENPTKTKKTVTMRRAGWSQFAHDYLSKVATPDTSIDDYHAQYLAGGSIVEFYADGRVFGVALCRIDAKASGKNEGVIVAACGNLPGVDLVQHVLPALEKMFIGVDSVRVHTMRRGLLVKLEKAGYAVSSIVLKKRVA